MLSHEHDAAEIVQPMPPAQIGAEMRAGNALTEYEDRLEDAVDRVCAPLIGTLPRADRAKRRAALRQELYALAAAHRELTDMPEHAVEEAIAHFLRQHPTPQSHTTPVAHSGQQTVSKNAAARHLSARPATLLALGMMLPAYVAIVYGWLDRLHPAAAGTANINLYRIELFVFPLVAGLLVGLLTQHRAVRGVFNACAAIAAWAVLVPSVLMGLAVAQVPPFYNAERLWDWVCPNPLAGYVGLVFWPLLGCAGAAAGAKLRRQIKIKPRRTRRTRRE